MCEMHKETHLYGAMSLKVCECRTKVVRGAALAHQCVADFVGCRRCTNLNAVPVQPDTLNRKRLNSLLGTLIRFECM